MLVTKIYDLATKFFPLVASCLLSKKVIFEPCYWLGKNHFICETNNTQKREG